MNFVEMSQTGRHGERLLPSNDQVAIRNASTARRYRSQEDDQQLRKKTLYTDVVH